MENQALGALSTGCRQAPAGQISTQTKSTINSNVICRFHVVAWTYVIYALTGQERACMAAESAQMYSIHLREDAHKCNAWYLYTGQSLFDQWPRSMPQWSAPSASNCYHDNVELPCGHQLLLSVVSSSQVAQTIRVTHCDGIAMARNGYTYNIMLI